MNTTVRTAMTRNPVCIAPGTTVPEAMALLKRHRIRHLPVVEGGTLTGIVTDRDLREAMPSDATSLSVWEVMHLIAKLTVREVMTRSVMTVGPDTPLRDAAEMLVTRRIGAVPVISDTHEVVGMLSVTDLLRVYAGLSEVGAGG